MDMNVLSNTKIRIQAIREAQFLEKGTKNLFDHPSSSYIKKVVRKAQVVEKRHDLVRVVSCRIFDIKCSFFLSQLLFNVYFLGITKFVGKNLFLTLKNPR
jgi:hypothetical protein